jgi:YHS domain-containing protein
MNTVIDPVCGMKIDPAEAAATLTEAETTWYFCSKGCKATFESETVPACQTDETQHCCCARN